MKKIGLLVLVLLGAISLFACVPTENAENTEEINSVLETLVSNVAVEYKEGEHALYSEVSRGENKYSIAWTSSDSKVIEVTDVETDNGGTKEVKIIVKAIENDTNVSLTAKIGTLSKTYQTKVLKSVSGPAPTAGLVHSFDFTKLTPPTGSTNPYVTVATDFNVPDTVSEKEMTFARLNSNIQKETTTTGTVGVILGIRSGNSFSSPMLTSKFAVEGLKAVTFTWENWRSDFKLNFADFVDKVVVESSADGTTWTEEGDVASKVNIADSAVNTFNVEIKTAGAKYFRIVFVAKTGISSTYQLRAIITSVKVYA